MEYQGPGLLACDEELFTRVWDRVTAQDPSQHVGEPVPEPPAAPAPVPAALVPAAQPPVTAPPVDPTCAALQRWTLRLLADGAELRETARRAGRQGRELEELSREKRQQARSLAAEYFLRTGVRYWPELAARPAAAPLLPALRGLYLGQRRRENDLRAQAAVEEQPLAEHYLALADAARAAARRLRALVERAW